MSLIAVAPAFEPEAKLPACCRRDGKHGCAMMAKVRRRESSTPTVQSSVRCASYPIGDGTPAADQQALTKSPSPVVAPRFSYAKSLVPTPMRAHQAAKHSWHVRGPPNLV